MPTFVCDGDIMQKYDGIQDLGVADSGYIYRICCQIQPSENCDAF